MTEQEVEAVLLAYIREGLYPDHDEVDDPPWQNGHYVHDWKRYIPDDVVELWPSLPRSTKLVAYILARDQAINERWD